MLDSLQAMMNDFYLATQKNPILSMVLLPVFGGIMYMLKDIPGKIWNLIVRYTTVTMSLNNAGFDGNIDAYNAFDRWFMDTGNQRYSRNFFMFRQYRWNTDGEASLAKPYRLGIGNGLHFFTHKGKLFWFRKGNLESSGSERQKEEIKVTTFGQGLNAFNDLVAIFNARRRGADTQLVHKWGGRDNGWMEVGPLIGRNFDSVCMDQLAKDEIQAKIKAFVDKKPWYRAKGLAYKTSFMFYGPPGTGKTTLCKALSTHFKRDLFIMDLSTMTNDSLPEALNKIKPGSILLMEDIDQAGKAVRDRNKKDEPESFEDAINPLTMSGVLNAFDGVISLDDLIIFMTTNHPEDIDKAFLRKSRTDYKYLINYMTGAHIEQYVRLMYDFDEIPQDILDELITWILPSVPGCDVEGAFKDNPDCLDGFMNDIRASKIKHANDPIPVEF